MAEVFGDRAEFAIEAGVEPDLDPGGGVWGHMCVWCRNKALGDISNRFCGFGPAYLSIRWLALNLDELWEPELEGLDDLAACNFFDGLLYGYHGDVEVPDDRTLDECRADSRRWCKFGFVTDWGENFDGYKAFILCQPGRDVRILSHQFPEGVGHSVRVSRDTFVVAADGFVRWFEAQQRRLR